MKIITFPPKLHLEYASSNTFIDNLGFSCIIWDSVGIFETLWDSWNLCGDSQMEIFRGINLQSLRTNLFIFLIFY